MIEEMKMLETLMPPTTDVSTLEFHRWRAVFLERISGPVPTRQRRSRRRLAAIGAVGVVMALGGAAAAASLLRDERPSPGESVAMSLDANGAALVVEPGAGGQVCIATRADRGRGSVCTARDAEDVAVAYTVSGGRYALGVFDPQQRATVVVVDGVDVLPSRQPSNTGELTYFSLVGVELPNDVRVLDGDGTELAHFTPAADAAIQSEAPPGGG